MNRESSRKIVYLKRAALAFAILFCMLIVLNLVPVWEKSEYFCSWCGKQEITFGFGAKAIPQPGSCPYSPGGKHQWRYMWSSGLGLLRMPRSYIWHADGWLSIYSPDLKLILKVLSKSDRIWFLKRYNGLLEKANSRTDREAAIAFERAICMVAVEIICMPDYRPIEKRYKDIIQCFESDRNRFVSEYLFSKDTVSKILAIEILVENRMLSLKNGEAAYSMNINKFKEKYKNLPF